MSQLPFSSSYKLEVKCDKHSGRFTLLECLSLGLKIAALLLLIVLFRYFYIAIAVWCLSIVVNFFKRNLLYRYVYSISDGILCVSKEYSPAKKTVCERLDLCNGEVLSVEIGDNGRKYFEEAHSEAVTFTKADGERFSIDADFYFYGLADYYIRSAK